MDYGFMDNSYGDGYGYSVHRTSFCKLFLLYCYCNFCTTAVPVVKHKTYINLMLFKNSYFTNYVFFTPH